MARHEQSRRFRKWMARERSHDKVRIETKLAFDIHRMEKGLSHMHFRYGFGINVLREMSQRMMLLKQVDPNCKTNSLYKQGLSVWEITGSDMRVRNMIYPKLNHCSCRIYGIMQKLLNI